MTKHHNPGIGHIQAALLMELILDLRGHPRLTSWEEQFALDMQRRLQEEGPGMVVSAKQRRVLLELRDKIGAELPDPDDELAEEPADNLDLERWDLAEPVSDPFPGLV